MWHLLLLLGLALVTPADALIATAGSPCAAACNSTNGTWWPDLVCSDTEFSTVSKGKLLKQCLQCEGQSLYVNGSTSDEYWYMFHMKYIQQYCLIDANPRTTAVQKCASECNPLKTVLSTLWISQRPFLPQYNYCTLDNNAYTTYAPECARCLQAQQGAVIVGNMADTMVNACGDQPLASNNVLVKTSRDLFNDTVIPLAASASPTASSTATNAAESSAGPSEHRGLSAGASAGIGVGVAIVLIAAAVAAGLLFLLRRRRRARLAHGPGSNTQPLLPIMGSQDAKSKNYYREMPAEPVKNEIYSHETLEADGWPVQKFVPIAELPATPHR